MMKYEETTEKHNQAALQIARFGLPGIILIFYITASFTFSYTPESTFVALGGLEYSDSGIAVSQSPIWMMLVTVGKLLGLDALLAAKVLGLFFACASILSCYVFSHHILQDRLLAFCASLAVALQFWLLQISVAGSALGLGLALLFMALFFLLRNEYVLAAIVMGLCALLFWQAALLLIVLFIDLMGNSVSTRRGVKVFLACLLVFGAAILPWIMYVLFSGVPWIPSLQPLADFPEADASWFATVTFLVLLILSGVLVLLRHGPEGRARLYLYTAPLMTAGILLAGPITGNADLTLLALPLLIVLAIDGGRIVLDALGHPEKQYFYIFVFTALLLVQSQMFYLRETRPLMERRSAESVELVSIAEWLRGNLLPEDVVAAESPGIVSYYAGHPIRHLGGAVTSDIDYIVSPVGDHAGYRRVFTAGVTQTDAYMSTNHFAVWRRE